jgi:hypothetical protein
VNAVSSAKGPATTGPATTGEAIALIEAAAGPRDLFGRDAVRCYRRLARLAHPDALPGDTRAAAALGDPRRLGELDGLLGRLYGPRKFRPFAIPA